MNSLLYFKIILIIIEKIFLTFLIYKEEQKTNRRFLESVCLFLGVVSVIEVAIFNKTTDLKRNKTKNKD